MVLDPKMTNDTHSAIYRVSKKMFMRLAGCGMKVFDQYSKLNRSSIVKGQLRFLLQNFIG